MTGPIRDQLQAAMERADLKQSELARRMGYADHNVVSRVISGKTQPPADRIEAWAAICGFRVQLVPLEPVADDLEEVAAALDADQRELLARIAGLLPALHQVERDMLQTMIRGLEEKYEDHRGRARN